MIRNRLSPRWQRVYDAFRFELATSRGRRKQGNNLPDPLPSYLHLGCDTRILDGFLNTDVFTNQKIDFGVDLRFPLPFPDASFRGIYAHHVVEHIGYPEARALFAEARRVLVPGGILRIVVPDLGKFLEAYGRGDEGRATIDASIARNHLPEDCETSLEVIDHLFRDRGFNLHHSAWDEETFRYRLQAAGFDVVKRQQCNVSDDPALSGLDNSGWEDHSIYIEASSPAPIK